MKPEKQIFKKGFTLMELMVYMGIVGIVVVIAGEAFSNSSRFRVRTDNMIKANQEAENVAMLFKEDVEQLGTKSAKEGDNVFLTVGKRIYTDPENTDENKKDSSSFRIGTTIIHGKNYSDLSFKRTRYREDGYYLAIDSIRWFVEEVDNKIVLKRSCWVLEKVDGLTLTSDDPCVNVGDNPIQVEMASDISLFNVEAASPGSQENQTQLFPPSNTSKFILFPRLDAGGEYERGFAPFNSVNEADEALGSGNEIKLSGFWSNYINKDDGTGDDILSAGTQKVNQAIAIGEVSDVATFHWRTLCLEHGKISFRPDTVYEISFIVNTPGTSDDKSTTFVPSKDHMSVGFRKATSGDYVKSQTNPNRVILPDFLFYPPFDNNSGAGKRTMRFTVPERVENVCLAFTFAFYSPLVSMGSLSIRDLKVSQVASANYKFNGFDPESDNNKKEKKNVKALKLKLQVSRGSKNGGSGETGNVNLIIPIPSNGTGD